MEMEAPQNIIKVKFMITVELAGTYLTGSYTENAASSGTSRVL